MKKVAKAIIHQDGKFLLQLRENRPDIPYPNCWSFFGGELEEKETPWEALQRELCEELEWYPEFGNFLWVLNDHNNSSVIHLFSVPFTGDPENLALHEGQAFNWFKTLEIKNNVNIHILVLKNLQLFEKNHK
tara:strand:+ start:2093 stop:2488 length:396 start_codon:yes stop_codon:yes gene_type:complete